MGVGTSKYFHLKREKAPKKKNVCSVDNRFHSKSSEIKNEVLKQLKSSCIGANIGKGGIAFYMPLKDDANIGDSINPPGMSPPCRPALDHAKRHMDVLTDSFTAKEREFMADVLKANKLREKGRWAKLSEERRLLALRRREKREEESKQKYIQKLREVEERRHVVEDRLRPKYSKVKNMYTRHSVRD